MTTAIYGNSLYTIVPGPTWELAQANATEKGGYLATILDEQENSFIASSFSDANFGYTEDKEYSDPLFRSIEEDIYWIGLTKESGSWAWTTGESLANYENWGPLEPYQDLGTQDRATMIMQGYDDVYAPWVESAGNWDNNLGEWYGIAEIPLNLSADLPAFVEEGTEFTVDINLTAGTTGSELTQGSTIWYQIDGVDESDFTNNVSLSGFGVIAESGNIVLEGATEEGIALNLAADSEDEGETLSISFYSENPDLSVYEPENLVVNGDFEADAVVLGAPNWNGDYLIAWTPTGWELLYGSGVDLHNQYHPKPGGTRGDVNTPYGNYVELDGMNNTGIAQSIQTTIGLEYVLSFDWALPSYEGGSYSFPDPSSQFDVIINGETVFSYDGSYGIRGGWTRESIVFFADSAQTRVEFREVGISDAEGTLLDNVSLTLSHNSYLDMIQIGEAVSAEVIDAVPAVIGTATSDAALTIISGDLNDPLVESYEITTTGKGKKNRVTTGTFTPIDIDQAPPLDALVFNGGDSDNTITANSFVDNESTEIDETRSAFTGVLVIDGKGGADTIIGGASGTNWLIGGGTSDGSVDTLTGVSLATDIFDLRKQDDVSGEIWGDAYSVGGHAEIRNYNSGDFIVLSGLAENYEVINSTSVTETAKGKSGKTKSESTTIFEITKDGDLVAQIYGSDFDANSQSSDLNLIYGQSTGSLFDLVLNEATGQTILG